MTKRTLSLLEAAKEMLSYIEDYAQSAERDDPVHELLPQYRAAIRKAARA